MSEQDEQRRELLLYGLVGDRRARYTQSATFRQSIDWLVNMLPIWVDAMAEASEKTDRAMAQQAVLVEQEIPGPLLSRDGGRTWVRPDDWPDPVRYGI